MILRGIEEGKSKSYSFSGMQKIVQRMRKDIGLPVEFTLDACRHGGMTELEEAKLTEGRGRAPSAHRTKEKCLNRRPKYWLGGRIRTSAWGNQNPPGP
jgi:hypothetical protein